MITVVAVAGALAVLGAWRLAVAGRLSIWASLGTVEGAAGVAALASGRVHLSPEVGAGWAALAGLGSGAALYLATVAFVRAVRRWPAFRRQVAEIYDQRKGVPLPVALILAAGVTACGEELFWRGLFQGRVASATGWTLGAAATWASYVIVNTASESLPIVAGAVVSGAAWGALALWTHGVLASLLCHSLWTTLMIARPPA